MLKVKTGKIVLRKRLEDYVLKLGHMFDCAILFFPGTWVWIWYDVELNEITLTNSMFVTLSGSSTPI